MLVSQDAMKVRKPGEEGGKWILPFLLASLCALTGALAILSSVHIARADTLCVKPGGGGGCYASIGLAITTANISDTIRVATGVYTENVLITKTVTLEGGWNLTFTQRDPNVFTTTIRPDDPLVAVVTVQGQISDPSAVSPTIDGFTVTGGRSDNHGGGIRMNDSNATVSHNIITDNTAYLLGGGVWVQRGAPLFENNRIENNALPSNGGSSNYGAGIELEGTQATLTGNIIASNVMTGGLGGGVAVEGGGPVTLTNNTITNNSLLAVSGGGASRGGGIVLENAEAILTGNIIASNIVTAIFGYGGGVAVEGGGPITLTGNTIISNSIAYGTFLDQPGKTGYPMSGSEDDASLANAFEPEGTAGGAGGGVSLRYVTATVSSNLIQGNIAADIYYGFGGGMYIYTNSVALDHNTIQNNIASSAPGQNVNPYGGGLYMQQGTVTLDRDAILNNRTSTNNDRGQGGGLLSIQSDVTLNAVRVTNNHAYLEGGLAFLTGFRGSSLTYTMTNSLVANNSATTYGGVTADSDAAGMLINDTIVNNGDIGIYTQSPLTLTNSIIMSHSVGVSTSITITENYNDFYSNTTNAQGFTLDPTDVTVNPHLTADYHLSTGSPVIDAGTLNRAPDDDIDGESRPMKGTSGLFKIDIGADEFTGPAQINQHLATDPADFTLIGPGNPQDNPDSTGSNDWIGYAVLGGDVNGDNRDDLFAGAPNLSDDFDGGVNDSGRVFGLYNNGTRRLGVVDLYTTTASLEVRSWIHQQHIGQTLAAADLNGDGAKDFIIGSPGGANGNIPVTGTVFAFAGGPTLSGTRTLSPTMQATWRFKSAESTQTFAIPNSLAAGQVNGSGPDDLVVGEALATGPGNRTHAGAVYIFFGSNNLPPLWDMATMPASLTIYGPANDAELGKVAIGDVNGDGVPDLVARSLSTIYIFYGPRSSGTIDLATTPADATITNASDGKLATGDVNGDGKADLIVGSGTEVEVVLGGNLPATQTLDEATWARFTGLSMSVFTSLWTADWNADGKAEILIGQRTADLVFVIFGSTGLNGTADVHERADWIIYGELQGDQFGYSLGSGDLDADGVGDLILGSRSHSVDNHPADFDDAGAVYVLYGSRGQPGGTPTPTVGTRTPSATPTSSTPTSTPTVCTLTFTDVPQGSTFYTFIRCLACLGIVNGYSDGTFRPNNNVTRGQLSKIVSNSAGFNDPQTTQMFEDVPPTGPQSTFFAFIGRLASRGYINGYPCGGTGEPCNPPTNMPYFRTNNNATRGQITKIVSNAAGFSDPPVGQIFEDVPPGSTFYTFTQRLASRSIMQGYPCGGSGEPCNPPNNRPYFRPFNNATRGQTSKIVANTFFQDCNPPARPTRRP